jgi:hypothetical protein
MKGKLVAVVCLLFCLLPARNAAATTGDNDATRTTLVGIKQFAVSADIFDDTQAVDPTAAETLAIEAALKSQGIQVVSPAAAAKLPEGPVLYLRATRLDTGGGWTITWMTLSFTQTVWLDRNRKIDVTSIETWSRDMWFIDQTDKLSAEINNLVDQFIMANQAVN